MHTVLIIKGKNNQTAKFLTFQNKIRIVFLIFDAIYYNAMLGAAVYTTMIKLNAMHLNAFCAMLHLIATLSVHNIRNVQEIDCNAI